MGNSVRRLFGFRAARPGRAEAMKFFRPAIDDAEVDVGEANDPVAAVGLGDADGFALQRLMKTRSTGCAPGAWRARQVVHVLRRERAAAL